MIPNDEQGRYRAPAKVKTTIQARTQPSVVDETAFQQLLSAAYVMQEHNSRLKKTPQPAMQTTASVAMATKPSVVIPPYRQNPFLFLLRPSPAPLPVRSVDPPSLPTNFSAKIAARQLSVPTTPRKKTGPRCGKCIKLPSQKQKPSRKKHKVSFASAAQLPIPKKHRVKKLTSSLPSWKKLWENFRTRR